MDQEVIGGELKRERIMIFLSDIWYNDVWKCINNTYIFCWKLMKSNI